ncbi:DEAD/DEAH box helicase, partial [Prevotella aurantiaca]|uniref:DEAD/DEAH box helicase n=1 Tax=Prevotella aurantiaca TaxID=596085 RepID=UPI0028ED5F1A
MNIQDIQKLYGVLPQGNALIKTMEEKSVRTIFLQGLLASATPMFFASIVKRWQKTVLFVLNDNDEAGYFYNDLKTIVMPDNANEQTAEVLFFPSSYRRAVKYGQRDAGNEILRTEVLSRLSVINEEKTTSSLPLCIVTEPSALAELVVAKHKLDEHTLSISIGQTIDLTETEKSLRSYGFQQVDYVYEPGQFAVRGSILDVYSFSSELPYRIDFFGNDVDTIRTFEVETQLSKDKKEKVEIVPELATLSEEKIPFLQFLPKESVLVMKDLLYIHDTIERIYNEGFTAQALTEQLEGKTEIEQNELRKQLQANLQLVTAQQFADDSLNFKRIEFGTKHTNAKAIIHFNISPQPLFHKNFELLTQSLKDYLLQGYKLYILADSEKQTARLRDIFNSKEINSEAETTSVADSIPFIPVNRTIHEGFVDNDLKVCFFTDHQIFDRFHKYSLKSDKARQGKMALTMKELQEMEPGDFLVHVDFGIGKFAGLVRVPAGESYQEMIRLVYQHNDIVDVSIHSLYKISKYRRADSGDAAPRLSVLGSGAWDRLKEKAKKRIKDIARDLIKLYAKRRHEKGYSFSPDSYMQHELEASFLYEDTPDQLKATQDLKQDMESSRPMDRLVCGDVGFGKTEVAVRAAFKAATDGKQVAVLVPTTVLAFQHYQTFKKRLKDMPVTVDYLSRARTAKQTKQVLADLAEGKIDILVGTHKLISKNVKWKDIGLLIIDEEQKFGVSTKEKLRQLKNNIDTLT